MTESFTGMVADRRTIEERISLHLRYYLSILMSRFMNRWRLPEKGEDEEEEQGNRKRAEYSDWFRDRHNRGQILSMRREKIITRRSTLPMLNI